MEAKGGMEGNSINIFTAVILEMITLCKVGLYFWNPNGKGCKIFWLFDDHNEIKTAWKPLNVWKEIQLMYLQQLFPQ